MSNPAFETVQLDLNIEKTIAYVILNRPEVHNAFNDIMIKELTQIFQKIDSDVGVRVVVLQGAGKSFCAGADLNWMKRVKDYSYVDNLKESMELAVMFDTMYSLTKPTIAKVQGNAIGGGTGLVAVCDMAIAASDARFSFSEVKLGLIPACISPYVIKKCGEGKVRELFLSGERIAAEKAMSAGLVNIVVPPGELDSAVDDLVIKLLSSGPEAIKKCKELITKLPTLNHDEVKKYTAEVIAHMRMSEEAQEGMNAFLEKRKPHWNK
ncbi:MAG TPA: enoyl-CoA hydratase/isomerase family protein [bacterium]